MTPPIRADDDRPVLPVDHPRLFDLDGVRSRWPTPGGMVSPTPYAWRFSVTELEAADLFYRDLLWAMQLELDGVKWPGQRGKRGPSIFAGMADVAHLWGLPSAGEILPFPTFTRYQPPYPRARTPMPSREELAIRWESNRRRRRQR